jgi:hypothetical protein
MALKLNLTGKLFMAAAGAWVAGKVVNAFIESRPRVAETEEEVLARALLGSELFQRELSRPGATAMSVIEALGIGSMSPAEFERVLGVPWPL